MAAIAFGQRAVVVDGNVERVIVRLNGIEAPVALAKPTIRTFADAQTPGVRPGDYAQAMMDLGATICTPRKPACVICPLAEDCVARKSGRQDELPAKAVKPARPVRYGSVFYIRREPGDVLVRTRAPKGLLGGMTEFPGSAWDAAGDPAGQGNPMPIACRRLLQPVEHGFTHFELVLTAFVGQVLRDTPAPEGCRWVPEAGLAGEALPSLMRKVAAAAEQETSS